MYRQKRIKSNREETFFNKKEERDNGSLTFREVFCYTWVIKERTTKWI